MYTPTNGREFGQHVWNAVYRGASGWIPVDSTFSETGFVDSGHIRHPLPPTERAKPLRSCRLRQRIVDRYREDLRSVPRHTEASLDVRPLRFVYLDCGRWGGTSNFPAGRHFAIVKGRRVALCEFHGSARAGSAAPDLNEPLMNSFLHHLRGSRHYVNVIAQTWFLSGPDEDFAGGPMYLLIGDLHLPIQTEVPTMGPGGAYVARPEEPIGRIAGGEDYSSTTAPDWHQRYDRGDIFEEAAPELNIFLDRLESFSRREEIHLVQAGDMYELWIGLERHFEHFPDRSQVALRQGQPRSITAQQFVEHWVGITNERNPVATRIQRALPESTWIYGNHDNYLAVLHPGIPERTRLLRRHGLYVEHGHQADAYNHDGEIEGHTITQQVFTLPIMREFDPSRRRHFITFAALRCLARRDFHIYVMAHTHSPYLTTVNVDLRLARVQGRERAEEEEAQGED